jgi:hypothetical protein
LGPIATTTERGKDMPATSCPICTTIYDGSNDHPWDPCVPCWKAGWRVDSCGNKYQESKHEDCQDRCQLKEHKGYRDCSEIGLCQYKAAQ